MTSDDLTRTLSSLDICLSNAEADLARLDKTVHASNERLTRLEGIVQEGISENRVHGFGRFNLQNSESIALSDVPVATVQKPANMP